MRKYGIAGLLVLVAALTVGLVVPASAGAPGASSTDFTLLDQTGGDTNARCRTTNGQPFEFNGSVRAINDDAIMRITFRDGDFVDYPIPQDTSFSLHQIAGTDVGTDNRIVVSASPSSVGDLVGWLSAAAIQPSVGRVLCVTNQF